MYLQVAMHVNLLPIYYQVKQTIRNWIINREYNPGDKIPSENELADNFKVSRLAVRQAISQLIQEGFLVTKRGEVRFVINHKVSQRALWWGRVLLLK